jgi:tetratricopeptide (TPR) repeat protein
LLDAAEEALDEAARRGLADDPRHAIARAAVAHDRGDALAARRWLDHARQRLAGRTPPPEWFHHAALASLAVGDARGARQALEDGLAAHPDAAPLAVNLAALHAAEGRADEAAVAARRAAQVDAALPQAQRAVGDACYRAGRLDEARARYRDAARLAPALGPELWARLGTLALRAGEPEEAAHAWERACSLDPDHPIARANLAALRRAPGAAPLS